MPQLEHSFELQMTYLGPILEHVGIVYIANTKPSP